MTERVVKIGLDADDIKDALRRRHPAFDPAFVGVGRWTCIEEWENIDLLALDAWASADVVGYEVKVSRADMRGELLKPSKRAAAVAMCTRFYFAVPAGLLTQQERAFEEPVWEDGDFERTPCPAPCRKKPVKARDWMRERDQPQWWKRGMLRVPIPRAERPPRGGYSMDDLFWTWIPCPACGGTAYIAKSRVELTAPQLWVPRDSGLIAVGLSGDPVVLKQAPRRAITEPIIPWPYLGHRRDESQPTRPPKPGSHSGRTLTPEDISRIERQTINKLVRWVSARPDPRHTERGTNR